MADIIIIAIILIVVGAALAYIIKAKKSGVKCIGCNCGCSDNKNGNCQGCCSQSENNFM